MKNLIVVKNLNKKNRKKEILTDINFKLNKNSVTAILGDSIETKSELLKLIVGLSKPEKGSEIKLDAKKVSYKPIKNSLDIYLTVGQNLSLYYDLRNNDKDNKDEDINEILEVFNLEEVRDVLVKDI